MMLEDVETELVAMVWRTTVGDIECSKIEIRNEAKQSKISIRRFESEELRVHGELKNARSIKCPGSLSIYDQDPSLSTFPMDCFPWTICTPLERQYPIYGKKLRGYVNRSVDLHTKRLLERRFFCCCKEPTEGSLGCIGRIANVRQAARTLQAIGRVRPYPTRRAFRQPDGGLQMFCPRRVNRCWITRILFPAGGNLVAQARRRLLDVTPRLNVPVCCRNKFLMIRELGANSAPEAFL